VWTVWQASEIQDAPLRRQQLESSSLRSSSQPDSRSSSQNNRPSLLRRRSNYQSALAAGQYVQSIRDACCSQDERRPVWIWILEKVPELNSCLRERSKAAIGNSLSSMVSVPAIFWPLTEPPASSFTETYVDALDAQMPRRRTEPMLSAHLPRWLAFARPARMMSVGLFIQLRRTMPPSQSTGIAHTIPKIEPSCGNNSVKECRTFVTCRCISLSRSAQARGESGCVTAEKLQPTHMQRPLWSVWAIADWKTWLVAPQTHLTSGCCARHPCFCCSYCPFPQSPSLQQEPGCLERAPLWSIRTFSLGTIFFSNEECCQLRRSLPFLPFFCRLCGPSLSFGGPAQVLLGNRSFCIPARPGTASVGETDTAQSSGNSEVPV
jgi:hypothetical protein